MAKKKITFILAAILILAVLCGVICSGAHPEQEQYIKESAEPVTGESKITEIEKPYSEEHEYLQECRQINPDVRAVIQFESGLIRQPVVQSDDNDHYLYTDWQSGESSELGSIVLDYENDLSADDMNTIIYGHYVYPSFSEDRTLMFTPLDLLKDPENYEDNQYVDLITESDVRRYQILSVFQCPVETVGGIKYPVMSMQYNLVSYDEIYFNNYLSEIRAHEYYETGMECGYEDRFLTLQTCVEGDEDSREVILCREIERIPAE